MLVAWMLLALAAMVVAETQALLPPVGRRPGTEVPNRIGSSSLANITKVAQDCEQQAMPGKPNRMTERRKNVDTVIDPTNTLIMTQELRLAHSSQTCVCARSPLPPMANRPAKAQTHPQQILGGSRSPSNCVRHGWQA